MNLKSFVNLFDTVPQINIGRSSTNKHPACMIDFQHVEMLIDSPNSAKFIIHNNSNDEEYFNSHRSIHCIKWNGHSYDIQLEGFYEETKPVTLIDVLYCFSNGINGDIQRLTISNYDITFNLVKDAEIPKFFNLHPDYLERTVKRMWYDKDTDSICITLEFEFYEIMEQINSML